MPPKEPQPSPAAAAAFVEWLTQELTQAEIARRAGVSPVVVSNWLANRIESANVEAHVRAKAKELMSEGSNHD